MFAQKWGHFLYYILFLPSEKNPKRIRLLRRAKVAIFICEIRQNTFFPSPFLQHERKLIINNVIRDAITLFNQYLIRIMQPSLYQLSSIVRPLYKVGIQHYLRRTNYTNTLKYFNPKYSSIQPIPVYLLYTNKYLKNVFHQVQKLDIILQVSIQRCIGMTAREKEREYRRGSRPFMNMGNSYVNNFIQRNFEK